MTVIEQGGEELSKGVSALEIYFRFMGSSVTVYAEKKDGMRGYEVKKNKNGYRVIYGKKICFFNALPYIFMGQERRVESQFENLGVMLDCARNGVPSVEGLKRFIAVLSLAGYSYLGLYLEDCFEVEGEPLFGYMRGRYSKGELREIVSFAEKIGMEVVPYIQTLAHLSRLFHHWSEYFVEVRDTNDILLVGEPRTYTLIEHVLATVAECFPSKRVNLGMDEAFMLGLGKYRERHGYADRFKIFTEHLNRVLGICETYNLKPQIWPDMYLLLGKDTGVNVPPNLTLDVCSYFKKNAEEYKKNIADARKFAGKINFASAVHKWYGYAPLNEYTETTALPAVHAAIGETDDFCVTAWGDDGAECSYNAVWYSLFLIENEAERFPLDKASLSRKANLLTGYTLEEWIALDLPNKVFDCKMEKPVNVSKYLLFEDAFMGIADRADSLCYARYFAKNGEILRRLSRRTSPYAGIYRSLADLCAVLELKSSLRPVLLSAYRKQDRAKFSELAEKVYPRIIRRVQVFYSSFCKQWHKENKPFGFEVQDVRLGGLVLRLRHQRKILMDYAVGNLKVIPELEEKSLSPAPKNDCYNGAECYVNYEMNVTYSALTHRTYN